VNLAIRACCPIHAPKMSVFGGYTSKILGHISRDISEHVGEFHEELFAPLHFLPPLLWRPPSRTACYYYNYLRQ